MRGFGRTGREKCFNYYNVKRKNKNSKSKQAKEIKDWPATLLSKYLENKSRQIFKKESWGGVEKEREEGGKVPNKASTSERK